MSVARYEITAVPKPRMTKRDKWAKRPCVVRYFNYCDELRELGFTLPDFGYHVICLMPMPKSWSKQKRAEMLNTPHLSRPDKDNIEKALLDATRKEDCTVWDGRITKIWAESGAIIVKTNACDLQEILKLIQL